MKKLTKRMLDAAVYAGGTDYRWDETVSNFGVRIYPSGKKSFVVSYRARGRKKIMVLGKYGVLTLDQARKRARIVLADVAAGADPSSERQAQRAGSPTVVALTDRYLKEHAEPRKKAKSIANDRLLIRKHILPALGQRQVADIERADIERFHLRIGKKAPTTANRAIALLSKAFNLAEVWGWRLDGSNPCRHVQRFQERKVERYLSRDELARLASVLDQAELEQSEMPSAIHAIRLLIYTGCRRGEILGLRWQDVDLERRCLFLPDSKTGQKTVLLSDPALEVLSKIEILDDNPHVITGARKGRALVNLKDPWCRLRVKAGIEDVRLHDLRHTFASFGATAGFSLPVIGKSLGHTRASTTERYAHLANDPVRQLVDRVGAEIENVIASPANSTTSP